MEWEKKVKFSMALRYITHNKIIWHVKRLRDFVSVSIYMFVSVTEWLFITNLNSIYQLFEWKSPFTWANNHSVEFIIQIKVNSVGLASSCMWMHLNTYFRNYLADMFSIPYQCYSMTMNIRIFVYMNV